MPISYDVSSGVLPDHIARDAFVEPEVNDYCPNCDDGVMIDGMCNVCGYPGCNGKMD